MRKRRLAAAAAAFTSAVLLAACGNSTSPAAPADAAPADAAPAELSGTISIWWSQVDREADVAREAINGFTTEHPDVKIDYHDGQDDDAVAKAIASGEAVDIAITSGPGSLGTFCSSGAFVDLKPYLKRDHISMDIFSDAAQTYTAFDGKQCALPWLNNAYGLYYNTELLKAAGFSAPPKTLSELREMALALTTYNTDGSIKTLGFNPLIGFYESTPDQWSAMTGATWLPEGEPTFGTDPAWQQIVAWQKEFVDEIGYDKLQAFTAGLGDEWSADHAFHTGQIAMMVDGEWRVAFVDDLAPNLKYATAPMPVADDKPDLYGGGFVSGSVAGLSKTAPNAEAAWALLKYLAVDTDVLVKLSNTLKNMPSTEASRQSPNLTLPEQSRTFLGIVSSPHAVTAPPSSAGLTLYNTVMSFWQAFQSGDGKGLSEALAKVDTDISNAVALSDGP